MKIKNILLIFAVSLLIAGLCVNGTFATTNTGTLKIEQIELQRAEQSNNNASADDLEAFVDGKPLLPAKYDTITTIQKELFWNGSPSTYTLWADDIQNDVDQFVFVKNTGTLPAYVRTWFAFEQGSMTEDEFDAMINLNTNTERWKWEDIASGVEINGNTYVIMLASYEGALPSENTTVPSLLQVMLYNTVKMDDVEKLDGDSDGKYDIMVFSQAVSDENAWSGIGKNHPWSEITSTNIN